MTVRYNPGQGYPLDILFPIYETDRPEIIFSHYEIDLSDLFNYTEAGSIPFLFSSDGKVMIRFRTSAGRTLDFKWFFNSYKDHQLISALYTCDYDGYHRKLFILNS